VKQAEPQPLFTLIVPVYNSQASFDQCLRSIQDQDYKNFEVVIINDGSSDESEAIASKYCNTDNRFYLYSKLNGGVSSARNLGLQHARGTYIAFVDSDDWLSPDYLTQFTILLDGSRCLIMQNHYVYKDGIASKNLDLQSRNYSMEEFSIYFKELNLLSNGHSCSKLYIRSIIEVHKIAFDTTISFAEDCLFMLKYLKYIGCVRFSEYAGYYYRKDNQYSLSSTHKSSVSELNAFLAFVNHLDELKEIFTIDQSTMKYIDIWLAKFYLRSIQASYRRVDEIQLKYRISEQRTAHIYFNRRLMSNLDRSSTNTYTLIAVFIFRFRLFHIYDSYMRLFMKVRQLSSRS